MGDGWRLERSVPRQTVTTLAEGSLREWVLADGTGGYAMGTVCGLRTRRYHGLLVVATEPPLGRNLALASLDPVLTLPGGLRVRLATHEWASGAVDPAGHVHLREVTVGPAACRWVWQVGDVVLEREVSVRRGRPAVTVAHRLLTGPADGSPVDLRLEALCTWRDVHGERRAGDSSDPLHVEHRDRGAVIAHGAYALDGPGWEPAGEWYLGARLREESARGLPDVEDLWCAGAFTARLVAGDRADVTAWAPSPGGGLARPPTPAADLEREPLRRAAALSARLRPGHRRHVPLVLAADAFVVRRTAGTPEVVAGYPWFGAWSRDTMIAYEGLFLLTDRERDGADLLRAYAATIDDGMLANTADSGLAQFNTVDATLWFAHAVGRHVEVTGDPRLAADVREPLEAVVAAHCAGTRYGIGVDERDGLLQAGVPGEALTWMDARVDDVGVTPRIGKPVEVQALWVRTLEVLADLRDRAGADSADLRAAAGRARATFAARFPAPGGWLYDVVDVPVTGDGDIDGLGDGEGAAPGSGPGRALGDDDSLRPNQVIALAVVDVPLVGDDIALAALDACARDLVTPLGLRSLSPRDPAYRGIHRGTQRDRDNAYHQGTVWPWLIGPYATAAVRLARLPGGARHTAMARAVVDSLLAHLDEWGIATVSETADGDAPHAATGCPAQAWSVAELLRAAVVLDTLSPAASHGRTGA